MPELRENPATKRWVIIATERAKRPEDFKKGVQDAPEVPPYDAKCPFCEGNESLSGEEIFAIKGVRVIPNKYLVLVPPLKGSPAEPKRYKSGIYLHMEGTGEQQRRPGRIAQLLGHAPVPLLLDGQHGRQLAFR